MAWCWRWAKRRRFDRHVTLRHESDRESLMLPWAPSPFEWSIMRAHQPRVFTELTGNAARPARV
jgi:hypothetical protein